MEVRAAREAWRAMFELIFSPEGHRRLHEACQDLGLSPGVLKVLFHLEPGRGVPMRDLADRWGYDASYVTSLADALEERGLVERRPHPDDRRVKVILLTEAGSEARDRAMQVVFDPPPGFRALTPEQTRTLRDLLRKVAAAEREATPARASPSDRPLGRRRRTA
ncbi:MAG TPA: MarR family transcriptional regulator [Actinomycetota bacterium]|nr:MarR family transcriptional regulator [Actinomycetota bacterium]